MKNIIIILTFFSLGIGVNSQSVFQFPLDSAEWKVKVIVSHYPDPSTIEYERLFFYGDSIINSKSYKKLFRSRMNLDFGNHNGSLCGFVRKDTIDSKLYMINKDSIWAFNGIWDTQEHVLFDPNIVPGDSLLQYKYSNTERYIYLDSIKTEYRVGEFRKVYYFTSGLLHPTFYGLHWVDGIGSNLGIVNCYWGWQAWGDIKKLACYYDSLTIFPIMPGECDTTSIDSVIVQDTIPLNTSVSFTIYPNPVYYYFQIKFEEEVTGTIEMFDAAGKLVLSHPLPIATNVSYISNKYEQGIYFVRFGNTVHKLVIAGD